MFFDQVRIYVKAGDGGNGAVAFRREKYIPYGGPSGGDGGKGGDVVLVATHHLNTLYGFARKREFEAANGISGRNKNRHGAGGADLEIQVPPGTLVMDDKTGEILADLTEHDQRAVIAKGGRGGRGNARFASPTNQTPRIAENGDPGEARWLRLELKLLADVGVVGKPNAGKSTLLSVVTAATPEIGPYPFTTLQPNLGVVALSLDETFVMADLPGLIEGASEGKGLGLDFLRHIERTRLVIHLLDGASLDPLEDFETINAELAAFGHGLESKPQIVVINKLDVPGVRDILPELRAHFAAKGYTMPLLAISAMTREGTTELMRKVYQTLQTAPLPELQQYVPVMRPLTFEDASFTVERLSNNVWEVRGGKIERAVQRTQLGWDDALLRLHGYLERQGVLDALRKAGVQEGDTVRIGEYELEWRTRDE
ncbi:MAG TPA: GTPase ObgE [Anaerolineae bacterium]|nr:GTPase ObgE [Anaerolineae bacterium]